MLKDNGDEEEDKEEEDEEETDKLQPTVSKLVTCESTLNTSSYLAVPLFPLTAMVASDTGTTW